MNTRRVNKLTPLIVGFFLPIVYGGMILARIPLYHLVIPLCYLVISSKTNIAYAIWLYHYAIWL